MLPLSFYVTMFFLFMVGHAVGDWWAQDAYLSACKNPKNKAPDTSAIIWPWALGSHALIHGGLVFALTYNLTLALLETFSHALIDTLKSFGYLNFHQDQLLHIACKLVYVALIYYGSVVISPWWFVRGFD